MKPSVATTVLLSIYCAASGSLFAVAETPVPAGLPLSRYQAMIDKSPFALATAAPVEAPPAPTASFAQDFYITGIAKVGNNDFVSIGSKATPTQHFSLLAGQTGPDGISLASVAWSPEPGKSKATLKKGTEFGTIGFDEAALATSQSAQPAPQPQPFQPVPGQPQAIQRRPFQPISRVPAGRPIVPGTPQTLRPGMNNQPGFPQKGRLIRPRIPSIPSAPQ